MYVNKTDKPNVDFCNIAQCRLAIKLYRSKCITIVEYQFIKNTCRVKNR